MPEPTDIVEKVLPKNLARVVYLLLGLAAVIAIGMKLQADRDGISTDIANTKTDILKALDPLERASATQGQKIDAIQRYYWSNADMNHWANQLDRANRTSVPAMIVPEVPAPITPVASSSTSPLP